MDRRDMLLLAALLLIPLIEDRQPGHDLPAL
ncbi:hypothetical protein ACVIJ6_004828 [Bradyrhizobium sp. USDA 4369]